MRQNTIRDHNVDGVISFIGWRKWLRGILVAKSSVFLHILHLPNASFCQWTIILFLLVLPLTGRPIRPELGLGIPVICFCKILGKKESQRTFAFSTTVVCRSTAGDKKWLPIE
jgi:hypothetical protein